ncbi:MAG: type I restriction enzyme endonuclease domain-containing protein, partial [Trebonia sp.]
PDRVRKLAADVVTHWAARSAEMRKFIGAGGKGMIVCASREICADLYEQIIAIKPDWHSKDVDKGTIKVVYTGDATDSDKLRTHVRRPAQNRVIQQRAKDPDDELELLIVNSMLLTGFDSPPLHTMFVDKPMRGAALMQALARVNRTFRNKQDGLLVGYAPLEGNLFAALAEYTARDQDAKPMGRDTDAAVAKIRDTLSVIGDEILSGYDWRARRAATGPRAFLNAVMGAVEYLRSPLSPGNQVADGEPNLVERFRTAASYLARMYAVARTHRDLADLRDDIAFFEEVRVQNARWDAEERRARGEAVPPEIELYLNSLTASAIEAGGVTDIYAAAGIARPDLSHLDKAFIER